MGKSDKVVVNEKRTLYVGGLDQAVDEKLLYSAFIPFGDLLQVQIPIEMSTRKLYNDLLSAVAKSLFNLIFSIFTYQIILQFRVSQRIRICGVRVA